RLIGIPARVNALAGLGFGFSSGRLFARLLRPFLLRLFKTVLNDKRSLLILQNDDDFAMLTTKAGLELDRVRVIRGAGVNLNEYLPSPLPSGVPTVMLASRMLWDKGVGEFVKAAGIILSQGVEARFVLVGKPDVENPSSITVGQLHKWRDSGAVEWWGHKENMPEVLSQATVICLPSYYGEGVPKVLLEAMACARPIITTNTPGCRDLAGSGQSQSGLLVNASDVNDLVCAIKTLLAAPSHCKNL
ncbi:MAG: glycosyltransferase, partial [Burkholderiales bacterium]|nr:glycosyltransferase [Burkholderiales bacterium]